MKLDQGTASKGQSFLIGAFTDGFVETSVTWRLDIRDCPTSNSRIGEVTASKRRWLRLSSQQCKRQFFFLPEVPVSLDHYFRLNIKEE